MLSVSSSDSSSEIIISSLLLSDAYSMIPFIKNKEICAIAELQTKGGKNRFGIVPCNNGMFSRLIAIPDNPGKYMLAEELILHFLPDVFAGYTVSCKSLIRVTRNADIDADKVYDEELNYRDHMA